MIIKITDHVNFKGLTAHKLFSLPKITEKIHEGLSWPLNDLFREALERQNSKFAVPVLSQRFLLFIYRPSLFIQRF